MMNQEDFQAFRNKIYLFAAAVLVVLMTTGVVDQVQQEGALNVINLVLNLLAEGFALYGAILAWLKSRAGHVTTIDLPNAMVKTITTPSGETIAGPANPVETGTVLTFDIGPSILDTNGE